jgi:hypothetical protein
MDFQHHQLVAGDDLLEEERRLLHGVCAVGDHDSVGISRC